MTYNNETFKAAMKKAFADCKANGIAKGASDGVVCAIASLRVVRDGLLAEFKAEDENAEIIKSAMNELIQSVQTAKLAGFCSNASAAAKAAGLESERVATLNALME